MTFFNHGTSTLLEGLHSPLHHYSDEGSGESDSSQQVRLHGSILASVLDVYLENSGHPSLFRNMLRHRETFAQAISELPTVTRERLQETVGRNFLSEAVQLSRNSDPDLFFEGLISLSLRQARQGRQGVGSGLLTVALEGIRQLPDLKNGVSESLINRMREELAAMEGRGDWVRRAPYAFAQVMRSFGEWQTLAGFAVGVGSYQIARAGLLARLLPRGAAPSLSRLFLARGASSIGGVASESLGFTLTTRGMYQLSGHSLNWSPMEVGKDVLRAGITFSFMRGGAGLARTAFNRLHGIPSFNPMASPVRLTAFSRVNQVLFPQAAMLGSLALAHRAQHHVGLRDEGPGDGLSLITEWAQFNAMGFMFHRFQPAGLRRWIESTNHRSESLWHLARARSRGSRTLGSGIGDLADTLGLYLNQPLTAEATPAGRSQSPIKAERPLAGEIYAMASKGRGQDGEIPYSTMPPPRASSATRIVSSPSERAQALEHVPLPVMISDSLGRVVYGNRLAKEIFARGEQGILGLRIQDLYMPVKEQQGVFSPRSAQGQKRTFQESIEVMEGPEGFRAHYLAETTELTKMRRQFVIARQQHKFNHDATNLWGVVLVYFDTYYQPLHAYLQEHVPEGSRLRTALGIHENAAVAVKGISELLYAARELNQYRRAISQDYELSSIIQRAWESQEPFRRDTDNQIRTEIEEGLFVRGAPSFMMHSIVNLIRNSYQAMEANPGEVMLRARREGEEIIIEVQDTGPGIPAENLPRIFEEGFTTKSEGTGTGLENVKDYVENLHQGRIEVETQLGEGTTFRIILPALPSEST